jgi:hypothetical protein
MARELEVLQEKVSLLGRAVRRIAIIFRQLDWRATRRPPQQAKNRWMAFFSHA